MIPNTLEEIAKYIVADGKGILAADESTPTCGKRFDSIGVESTEESRRDYREMLFRSSGMKDNIGGVILFDETIRQSSDDGTSILDIIYFQGALPGIKVDKGLEPIKDSPEETITKGLDGLSDRCEEYSKLGSKFTKWRAVIRIGETIPTNVCIKSNMEVLAVYAKIAQDHNMVPIVEPEVLMDGDHSIEKCNEISSECLNSLFNELDKKNVNITGTLLKPSMVTSGSAAEKKAGVEEVAQRTIECLRNNIPNNLPGVTFLSGGQSEIEATEHLDQMNKIGGFDWKLSFSYGRALQQGALKAWSGKPENVDAAQAVFSHRALMNRLAAEGRWEKSLEG